MGPRRPPAGEGRPGNGDLVARLHARLRLPRLRRGTERLAASTPGRGGGERPVPGRLLLVPLRPGEPAPLLAGFGFEVYDGFGRGNSAGMDGSNIWLLFGERI